MAGESEDLKKQLLKLGRMVETSIMRSITALAKQDKHLAKAVVKEDEQIDRMEVEIEEQCISLLEQKHLTGSELRFVLAVIKINDALERIGDLAENIAGAVSKVDDWNGIERVTGCHQMATRSQAMVKKSLDALMHRDVKIANQVIADDRFVDEMRRKLGKEIAHAIDHSTDSSAPLLRLEYVTRQLERMADMATNIAEDVIYMIDGKIVRHPSRFDDDSDILLDGEGGRFRRVT